LIETSDGRTILGHVLSDLKTTPDLASIVVITNGKFFEVINKYVSEDNKLKGILVISDNSKEATERLGALGDLLFVLDDNKMKNSEGYLLVLPSDTVYWKAFSIKDFIQYAIRQKDSFVMAVRRVDNPEIIANRFGCVVIDNNGKVVDFEEKPEKPKSNFASSPFYMYDLEKYKALLTEYKKQGGNLDSPGNFIPFLIKKGIEVSAFIVDNRITDAGTPEDISRAKNY